MNRSLVIVFLLLLVAAGAGVWYWWQRPTPPATVPVPPTPPAETRAEEQPAAPEPEIRHPIEEVAPEQPAEAPLPPERADETLEAALVELLGRDAVSQFLRLTDLPLRFVATVDNLGRAHATPKAWPVQPMPGRFAFEGAGEETRIGEANFRRYDAFVDMLAAVDTKRAVALYKKHYPQFQQAYAELGFPNRYFNDRLIAVIDLLLATPEPEGPLRVRPPEVMDEGQKVRPWAHYRFADPELEALPAGQKMMLRIGPGHRARLQAKLQEVRVHLVGGERR